MSYDASGNLKYADAKFIFLTDFDGTITMLDSNDHMVDTVGMGFTERRKINEDIIHERTSYRDGFRAMVESVHRPFKEMEELVRKDVTLDPGFKEFHAYAKANNIPIIVVSSGMTPIIRSIFSNLIGEEEASKIDVISNEVKFTDAEKEGKTWELVYRHPDNHFGHDKSEAILPYTKLPNKPVLFFAGDGISDFSAARHADHLLAKEKGDGQSDLIRYVEMNNIDHVKFRSFTEVTSYVKKVVDGEIPTPAKKA